MNDVKKNCGFGAGWHPLAGVVPGIQNLNYTQAKILETHSTVHRVGLKLHQSDQVGFKDGVQPEKEANFASPCQEEKTRKLCCRIFCTEEVSSKIVEY